MNTDFRPCHCERGAAISFFNREIREPREKDLLPQSTPPPALGRNQRNGPFVADGKCCNTMTYSTPIKLSGNVFQFLRVSSTEATEQVKQQINTARPSAATKSTRAEARRRREKPNRTQFHLSVPASLREIQSVFL
jgi:hypothetical protein